MRRNVFEGLCAMAREAPLTLTLCGDSMRPALRAGQRVTLAWARWYLPGDILTYLRNDGELCTHRLLGYRLHRGKSAFVTRGDGAGAGDAPVPPGQVVGRLVAVDRCTWRPALRDRLAAGAWYVRYAARFVLRRLSWALR